MARTTRNFTNIKDCTEHITNIPKFPKRLAKTWSMESQAIDEIKEGGFKPNNRVLQRANKAFRNTFLNSSYKELIRRRK